MSKFSLLQSNQSVFRPSSNDSGVIPWLLIVGFLILIGLLIFLNRSVAGIVKVTNTPPPNPGPSAADLRHLTEQIERLYQKNQHKP